MIRLTVAAVAAALSLSAHNTPLPRDNVPVNSVCEPRDPACTIRRWVPGPDIYPNAECRAWKGSSGVTCWKKGTPESQRPIHSHAPFRGY